MSRYKIFFISLSFAAITFQAFAQTPERFSAALPNYIKALESKNSGVVESAIENLFKLKMAAPQLDYSEAISKLNDLSNSDSSDAICYKAFIGQIYLQHPERFNWLGTSDLNEGFNKVDQMFAKIEIQINQNK